MKLMAKLMKKNNKGMSLVELICAVAILGLTTTALGGAMIISAQHYQRDSAEFEIQQEAQTATNLVGNLVVDSANAEWDSTNKILKVKSDNADHLIYQEGTVLKYKNTTDNTEGVLAEGLAPNGFVVNDAAFDNNKNINITLKLENDGNTYSASYNATSRNGKLSSTKKATNVCVISMEDEAVVEPNQYYEMPVEPLGMTLQQVNNFKIDPTTIPSGWVVKLIDGYTKVRIEAPADPSGLGASNSFQFTIKTGDESTSKDVTVKVREVQGMDLNWVSGSGFTTSSEYVFKVDLSGTELNKSYGKSYDLGDFQYVDTSAVQFTAETSDGTVLPVTPDPNVKNVFKVTLNTDIPYYGSFTVKAVAKHPNGENKAKAQGFANPVYDSTLRRELTYINVPQVQPGVTFPSEFKRGDDFTWVIADYLKPGTWVGDSNHIAHNVQFKWFIRYREDGKDWTAFVSTKQKGLNQKIAGDDESRVLDIDKKYFVQFVLAAINGSNEMVWPHDATLLTQKGFAEAGIKQGWDDATLDPNQKVTDEMMYGGVYPLPPVQIAYYNKNTDAGDDRWNVPVDTQVLSLGSASTISYDVTETVKLYFDTLYLQKKQGYDLEPIMWIDNGTSWEKKTASDYFNIGKGVADDGWFTFSVKSGKDSELAGKKIRIGFELFGGKYAKLSNSATLMEPKYDLFDIPVDNKYKMYKEGTDSNGNEYTDGFVYFKFND